MTNTPKVSVIIPIYNIEKYLRECLDSVTNQTLKEIEIICIDDGSSDNSYSILKKYAENDNRFVISTHKNKGVGATRNDGIKQAKGEFVCFMDPDDLYPTNDILETLYSAAIENQVKICGGEFSQFSEEIKLNQDFPKTFEGYLFEQNALIDYSDYQFDYGYHRFLYNREFLISNNIFFPEYKRFQDPPFFVNAMIQAKKFYALKKISYGYRFGHNQVKWTSEKVNDFLLGIYDNFMYAKEYKLKKLKQYTIIRLLQHFKYIKSSFDFKSVIILSKIIKVSEMSGLTEFVIKLLLKKLLSVENHGNHKVITALGFQLKIKRNKNKNTYIIDKRKTDKENME